MQNNEALYLNDDICLSVKNYQPILRAEATLEVQTTISLDNTTLW